MGGVFFCVTVSTFCRGNEDVLTDAILNVAHGDRVERRAIINACMLLYVCNIHTYLHTYIHTYLQHTYVVTNLVFISLVAFHLVRWKFGIGSIAFCFWGVE